LNKPAKRITLSASLSGEEAACGGGVLRDIRLTIDGARCQACGQCLAAKACKVRAIVVLDPGEAPYLDVGRCYDCRLCVPACPFGAIVVNGSRLAGEDR
jgi:MinD superfamily P-loop ATPase